MACLIAVPITSAEPPLAAQASAAFAGGADLVELRVDAIGDAPAVEALLAAPHAGRFILTIRAASEGGHWDGDDAERIALYEKLGLLLPGYIDVELATWQRSANLRQKMGLVCHTDRERSLTALDNPTHPAARPKNQLILSHHDWRETPADLDAIFDALATTPAAVIKAVFTARDARDGLRVLDAMNRRAPARPTIALAMGEGGLLSRVLARKFNAFLTFGALSSATASAPGQPTLHELRRLYRFDAINAATRIYGVIGSPISHSRSPLIHNAAFAADAIDAVYLPLSVAPEESALTEFLDAVSAAPWLDLAGLSVTLPHKEHALRWLVARGHELSPLAARCGCVNTLVRLPDAHGHARWRGDNTDARGTLTALDAALANRTRSLPRAVDSLSALRVDILGAGGVARAVVAALVERGAKVTIYNRTPQRAATLAAEFGCTSRPWEQRRDRDGDAVVNCTTIGMAPRIDASPLPPETLTPSSIVFDTVYVPARTRLLLDAAAAGCHTISGVELFLAQAAEQYQLWHGRPAPLTLWRTLVPADEASPPAR